jgi:hypothetical protein
MAYPTTAALVAASTNPTLRALDAAQQDGLRAASIAAIEEYTGQKFDTVTETRVIDGSGNRELLLPARLISFTAISVNGYLIPSADLQLRSDGGRIAWKGAIGGNYYSRTLADLDDDAINTFPYEAGSVSITGTWGWASPPSAVETAIRYDMEDQAEADANALSSTLTAYRRMGLRDISQGNLRASIAVTPPPISPRAASLLDPYIWQGEIGRVV